MDVERYDRTRPRYPRELIQRVVAAAPGLETLDVGIGTGIEARQFQALGCRVLGVEPDPRMAEFVRGDGIDVEVATFEAWEPAGRRFDLLVSGQAWHWVDPVAGAVKAAEVLRPDGIWAAFWHVSAPPPSITDALAETYRRLVPDSPIDLKAGSEQKLDAYAPLFAKASDGLREAGAFSEPEQWRHEWEREYTRDEWLDQLPTIGALTGLPAEDLREVLTAVGTAIDDLGGRFTLPYATVAVTAVRG